MNSRLARILVFYYTRAEGLKAPATPSVGHEGKTFHAKSTKLSLQGNI